jgi:hypothetical protein
MYRFVTEQILAGAEVRAAVMDAVEKFGRGFETIREVYEEYERARAWYRDY